MSDESTQDVAAQPVTVRIKPSRKGTQSRNKLPRKRKLTAKQAHYVSALIAGANPTDAAYEAFKPATRQSASVIGSQLLNHSEVKSTLAEMIRSGGYDSRVKTTWDRILDDQATQDQDNPQVRMQANQVALKAIDQLAKIGGLIAPKQVETRTLNLSAILPDRKTAK